MIDHDGSSLHVPDGFHFQTINSPKDETRKLDELVLTTGLVQHIYIYHHLYIKVVYKRYLKCFITYRIFLATSFMTTEWGWMLLFSEFTGPKLELGGGGGGGGGGGD
ncbi:hypothetical protein ACJX0J_015325 [Zea mays]